MPTNSEKHMQDFLQTHKWPFQMFWLCLMWDLQQTLSSVITPRNWILFTLCSQPLKTKGTWSNSLVYLKLHLFFLCRCFMNAFSLAHTWRKSNTGGCFTVLIFICTLLCISVCWSWQPECTQFTAAPAGGAEQQPSRWPWRHPGLRCRALESLRSFSVLLEENTKIACCELWPCLSLVDDDFTEHLKR